MLLKTQPEWKNVELSLEYLTQKPKIEINEVFLFNQITTVRDIVKNEMINSEDWKSKCPSEKWVVVFSKMEKEYPEQYSDVLKICEYIFAIPDHNANVERIFSLMEIQWTDERNRLLPETVEAILQCLVNYDMTCDEMYDYLIKTPQLLKAAKSNEKYK